MELQGPIIVVDDDPDDHVIFKTIFEMLEVTSSIKYFDSANTMLEYLKTTLEEPFIIFCDINMPMISGLDLRENIYYDHDLRRKNIPFVFLSNAAQSRQVNRAYELTVQGYFTKASTFEETQRKIKLILQYWLECEHPSLKKEYGMTGNHHLL